MPASDYRSYSRFYDLFPPQMDDVSFYAGEAKGRKNVLELACGTGRVTIPIAKQGTRITGLDLSAEMLAQARKKAREAGVKVRFVECDMRDFRFREKFDLILIPFRSFLALQTVEDQKRCLACCKKHLAKGGKLEMNMLVPNLSFIANGLPPRTDTAKDEETGLVVKRSHSATYDQFRQLVHATYRIRAFKGRKKVFESEYGLTLRYAFRFELQNLFEGAGFRVKHLYGDFARGKFDEKSTEMAWVLETR